MNRNSLRAFKNTRWLFDRQPVR